jgi:hypothetical protein
MISDAITGIIGMSIRAWGSARESTHRNTRGDGLSEIPGALHSYAALTFRSRALPKTFPKFSQVALTSRRADDILAPEYSVVSA